MDQDRQYYEQRERAERAAAKNTPNLQARRVHQQLAENYAARAQGGRETTPGDEAVVGLPHFTILGRSA